MVGATPYDPQPASEPDPVAHRPGCRRPGLVRRRHVAWARGGAVLVEVVCPCGSSAVVEPSASDVWLSGG